MLLVSVCSQQCFAYSFLHMENEISWWKKCSGRIAARIVSSCLLPLLVSEAELAAYKGRLVSSQLGMTVCSGAMLCAQQDG